MPLQDLRRINIRELWKSGPLFFLKNGRQILTHSLEFFCFFFVFVFDLNSGFSENRD